MKRLCLVLPFIAVTGLSLAHHGRRFVIVTEFQMPHPHDVYLVADYGALKFDRDWNQEASPGFLLGLGDQGLWALEVHGHFEKEGAEPWRQEATGIELRRRLTMTAGWNLAAAVESEIPKGGGPTAWSGQLIVGKEDLKNTVMFNLVASNEEGFQGKTTWSYRSGWSPTVSGPVGYSLEAQGELKSRGSHEALLGIVKSFGESSLLKFGVGAGLTKESPDWIVRAGIVHKI